MVHGFWGFFKFFCVKADREIAAAAPMRDFEEVFADIKARIENA